MTPAVFALNLAVHGGDMASYTLATAERDLAILLDRAVAGEEVVITDDRGHVVEMKSREANAKPEPGSLEWLSERRRSRPGLATTSVELLEELYGPRQ